MRQSRVGLPTPTAGPIGYDDDPVKMIGPLAGVRVVELTLAGAGPFAGACLAALGAEVIKLERPQGDTSLEVVPRLRGLSHLYLAVNTGKRSIIVDLRQPADRALVYDLVGASDVFLQNMRVGVAERLGLGPADLARLRPDLVWCAITGYGETGPLARDACNDPTAQAFSGFASLNGRSGDPPELFRTYAHLDVTTASYAVFAILAALHRRRRTGQGSRVHVSLLSAALANAGTPVAAFRRTGQLPPLRGSAAPDTAPHRAFRGSDGVWFTLGVVRDEHWASLCRVLDCPALGADPRFVTNLGRLAHRDEIEAMVAARLAERPAADWIALLVAAGVPAGPVFSDDFAALRAHPQIASNGVLAEVVTDRRGRIWLGAPPWRFSRTPAGLGAAPEPGQDGAAIRREAHPVGPRSSPQGVPTPATVPLAGLRVVEVAGGLAGPYAGKVLSDAGAEVLKIEGPDGDPARAYGPNIDGESVPFWYLNTGKTISAASALGHALREADALIVDRDERWLDPSIVAAALESNPRLVVCWLSGYGSAGPLRDLPAAELVVQGLAGYLGSLGSKGEEPIRLGADVAGLNTGLAAAQAVIAALLAGGGQQVDVSALGTLIHLRSITWAAWSDPDEPIGFAYDTVARSRDFGYTARDRRLYVATGRGTNEEWARFLIAIGLDDYLTHPVVGAGGHLVLGTAPYAEEWRALFDRAFSRFSAAELTALLREIGGKPSVVHRLDEVLRHPQTAAGAALDADGLPRPILFRDLAEPSP
ncbi:MAG: hypothetical protein KatS3mg060_2504 [Dehalococcoidia bacterium]|nr:MAG: hypothetical protein KatS3mg060_2504 [Dehalococcoidia bacterium]